VFLIVQISKFALLCKYYVRRFHTTPSGRRGEEMAEAKNKQVEIANKRVALTPSTWAALSNIKPPGKSLGDTVADLIAEHQKRMLERDLDEIDPHGNFIPWEEAKKDLGL
jgi:hypothetical protein